MTIRRNTSLVVDEAGAAAVEFALIAPVFFAMLLGIFYSSMLGFSSASLHSAVESAARCRSMGIECTNPATTQTHARKQFSNVTGAKSVFASTTQACGNRVTGTVNFHFDWVISDTIVPLTAAACFPA